MSQQEHLHHRAGREGVHDGAGRRLHFRSGFAHRDPGNAFNFPSQPTHGVPEELSVIFLHLRRTRGGLGQGFLGGRQIVFRTTADPWQTQRYDQLLWDEPVPRALSRHLAASIRAAGLFRFVLIPADRGRADYLLGGEVERFEHLPTATPPRVAGTLSLTLMRASDRRPLLVRRYDAEEIVAGETPAAMAAAATRLADRLAAAVVTDLQAWRQGKGTPPDPEHLAASDHAGRPLRVPVRVVPAANSRP